LNTKDIEVLNNIANKLVPTNTTNPNPTIKKKKMLNKNASCENVKSLIDTKNKEIEIFNKINNFSIKYADKQNINLNTSNIGNKSSKKKRSLNNSLNKSTSKNATPKKNQNKNLNNNNNQNMININNSNNNSLYNLNNISSASFNNSMFQSNRQKEDFNTINESKIRENFESLNKFYNTNSTNNPLLKNNTNTKQDYNTVLNQNNLNNSINMNSINNNNFGLNSELSVKPKKGDHSPHKISKINPILPDDFENCAVSDEDDHLPDSNLNKENLGLNRSIVLKPKPPMAFQNNLIKNYSDKIILEEESVMENNSISKNEVNLGGAANKNLNDSFKNLNNSSLNNGNNAEKNNKELLKALNNMEHEINKSSFNNMMNSKSQISNNSKNCYFLTT